MLDLSPVRIKELSEKHDYEFWQLRTPLTGYKLSGLPYGLDNGCFSDFRKETWRRLIEEAKENKPIFACLPDVVGDAQRTLELFWLFMYEMGNVPRAFVLQDGVKNIEIPWRWIDAVFVGGSDAFKSSQECANAVKAAKMLDKWVHVGRVNTRARLEQWFGVADSIDGSGLCRFDHMLDAIVPMLKGEDPQKSFLSDTHPHEP